MPRVLVTGGAGFIGSHIVDGLLATNAYVVRVMDNLATGKLENLRHCLADIEFVEADVRDADAVSLAVRGVDYVLHQAALPSVPRSIQDPVTSNSVNVGGTVNVLDAARRNEVRRVVFASSSSVYGDSETLPKREAMDANPKSPYAVSKLAGEHYCRVFSSSYRLDTLAIRYFNVFGPRQDPTSQYSGVMARFCASALTTTPYTVFGDGHQTRDFTYVSNVVKANLLALRAPRPLADVVNVACGDRVSLLEMIAFLNKLSGHDVETRFEPERPGDVRHSQAAIERAKEVLGYTPDVAFERGLELTLQWYAGRPRASRSNEL